MTDDHDKGLYRKFEAPVRTDGCSVQGEKHFACDYFVLDLTHDLHAVPALEAYEQSCKENYPSLALGLRMKIHQMRVRAGIDACEGGDSSDCPIHGKIQDEN